MPYSLRRGRGFFNVPKTFYYMCRACEAGLRFIILITLQEPLKTECKVSSLATGTLSIVTGTLRSSTRVYKGVGVGAPKTASDRNRTKRPAESKQTCEFGPSLFFFTKCS